MFASKGALSQIFNESWTGDKLYLICMTQLSLSLGTYRYRDPRGGIGTGLSLRLFLFTHGGHNGHLAAYDLAILAEERFPSEDPQRIGSRVYVGPHGFA